MRCVCGGGKWGIIDVCLHMRFTQSQSDVQHPNPLPPHPLRLHQISRYPADPDPEDMRRQDGSVITREREREREQERAREGGGGGKGFLKRTARFCGSRCRGSSRVGASSGRPVQPAVPGCGPCCVSAHSTQHTTRSARGWFPLQPCRTRSQSDHKRKNGEKRKNH